MESVAKRFLISGRVQGVGYRYFAQREAQKLGVTGWARNLDDGRVEVYANGAPSQLDDYDGRLRQGPPHADVRSVEVLEASPIRTESFHIR